jgi:NAD(P)-dependent dehydrogenase (short-subunit alcohol dehydrogenase family)
MDEYKNTLFDLDGEIAVVTGGMGQLGSQFALTLSRAGAKVAILDLAKKSKNSELQEKIASSEIILLNTDLTDNNQIISASKKISEAFGSPSILVNNAALDSPPGAPAEENGPFESYPESSWDKIMEINVKSAFLCSQVFGDIMARNGNGSIINISSIYGMVSPDQSIYDYRRRDGQDFYKPVAYSTSKSALYNLSRYLAVYWAKKHVRVNTVTFAGVFNNQDKDFLKSYTSRIPIGRMAEEDEYNGAILFLASSASKYMTGSNLVIDGGWTAI